MANIINGKEISAAVKIRIKDEVSLLKEKGYDPIVYRFFCLQSHYRKSLVFSYENLDNAAGAYTKLVTRIARLLSEPASDIDKAAYDELMNGFKAALDNDLNTSLAVTALYDVLKAETNASTKLALIAEFDKVLSLDLIGHAKKEEEKNASAEDDIPEEIRTLAEQRKEARKAKDFALADSLRDKIAELGYVIEETRQGTKITRK